MRAFAVAALCALSMIAAPGAGRSQTTEGDRAPPAPEAAPASMPGANAETSPVALAGDGAVRMTRTRPADPGSNWTGAAPVTFSENVDPRRIVVAPVFSGAAALDGVGACLESPESGAGPGYWRVRVRTDGPLPPGDHPLRILARKAEARENGLCDGPTRVDRLVCTEAQREAGACAELALSLIRPAAGLVAGAAIDVTAVTHGPLIGRLRRDESWTGGALISASGGPAPTLLDPASLLMTLRTEEGRAQRETLRLAPADGGASGEAIPLDGRLRLEAAFPLGTPAPGVYKAVFSPLSPDSAGEAVEIPVTVTVRYWSGYLLIAIALGVALGWLIRVWLSRRAARAEAAAAAARLRDELFAQAEGVADPAHHGALAAAAAALAATIADPSAGPAGIEKAAETARAARETARAEQEARVAAARAWLEPRRSASAALSGAGAVAAEAARRLEPPLLRFEARAATGDFGWWDGEAKDFDDRTARAACAAVRDHAAASEHALTALARERPDLAAAGVAETAAAAKAVAEVAWAGGEADKTLETLAETSAAFERAVRETLCGTVAGYARSAVRDLERDSSEVAAAARAVREHAYAAAESLDAAGFAARLATLGDAAAKSLGDPEEIGNEDAASALRRGEPFKAAQALQPVTESMVPGGVAPERVALPDAPSPGEAPRAALWIDLPARAAIGSTVEARLAVGAKGATAPEGEYRWRYGAFARTAGPVIRIPVAAPGALRVEAAPATGGSPAVGVVEVDEIDPALTAGAQRRTAAWLGLAKGLLVSALIIGTGYLLHDGAELDLMTLALAFSWGFAINITEETLTAQLGRLKGGA